MNGENLLVLFGADSALAWGRSFQIAMACIRLGHRVCYIDLPRPLLRHSSGRHRRHAGEGPIELFQPIGSLPSAKLPLLRYPNYLIITAQISRYLEQISFVPSIIWAYAPYEPQVTLYLREKYRPRLVVYDIADERVALAAVQGGQTAARVTESYERELAGYCDALVTITGKLKQTKRHLHKRIEVMANGIDLAFFSKEVNHQKPALLSRLTGKVVLYIGAIESWVDIEAVAVAASFAPELNFVLVGPVREDISILERQKNIHMAGIHPFQDIPAWIAHADVCILPFRDNEITRNSDPLKLLQYLAIGKPVVSLYFEGVNDFEGAVDIAGNHQEFAVKVRLLAYTGQRRSSFQLACYDWQNLMHSTLNKLLYHG